VAIEQSVTTFGTRGAKQAAGADAPENAMSDFDNVLTRIGTQIEEIKKRIRSSRDRAGHSSTDAFKRQDESTSGDGMQTLPPRTENRPDQPPRKP
jgi:hypothetical protein